MSVIELGVPSDSFPTEFEGVTFSSLEDAQAARTLLNKLLPKPQQL